MGRHQHRQEKKESYSIHDDASTHVLRIPCSNSLHCNASGWQRRTETHKKMPTASERVRIHAPCIRLQVSAEKGSGRTLRLAAANCNQRPWLGHGSGQHRRWHRKRSAGRRDRRSATAARFWCGMHFRPAFAAAVLAVVCVVIVGPIAVPQPPTAITRLIAPTTAGRDGNKRNRCDQE